MASPEEIILCKELSESNNNAQYQVIHHDTLLFKKKNQFLWFFST